MLDATTTSSTVSVRGAALVRRGLALAALASVLLAAPLANARPEYTGYIFDAIPEMVCVPQCIICHSDNLGGASTWTAERFGLNNGGRISGEKGARGSALATILKASDSTMPLDMVSDFARLKDGLNPNTGAEDTTSICAPAFGCGARIAPALPVDSHAAGAALLSGLVMVGLLLRRRR